MNSERAYLRAQAIIAEAQGKQASHLRDADSLQTRAKFRYISAQSRQQKQFDLMRQRSMNDILEQFGEVGALLLDPDNPMRNQIYEASDSMARARR